MMMMMMSGFAERVINSPQTRCRSAKQVGLQMSIERQTGESCVTSMGVARKSEMRRIAFPLPSFPLPSFSARFPSFPSLSVPRLFPSPFLLNPASGHGGAMRVKIPACLGRALQRNAFFAIFSANLRILCVRTDAIFIFGRPFVKRFALCYRAVVLSVLSVLSVTLV